MCVDQLPNGAISLKKIALEFKNNLTLVWGQAVISSNYLLFNTHTHTLSLFLHTLLWSAEHPLLLSAEYYMRGPVHAHHSNTIDTHALISIQHTAAWQHHKDKRMTEAIKTFGEMYTAPFYEQSNKVTVGWHKLKLQQTFFNCNQRF